MSEVGATVFRRAGRRAFRVSVACSGVILLLGWQAEEGRPEIVATAQARAANAEFLATAIPPGPAAGICLVDTGVDHNPDTAAVVERLALAGGDGSDADALQHGTGMAMFIGASRNGFGTVGIFPAARIVSVRATPVGSDAIMPAGYVNGVKMCINYAPGLGVRVIEIALTSPTRFVAEELLRFQAAFSTARARGLVVVVAAGNNGGGGLESPADQPGVMSVGGSAWTGELCPGSASGASLQAPGCGLEEVDAQTGDPFAPTSGTSQASALVAATAAALSTWRPEFGPAEIEATLRESGRPTPDGPVIDAAAAFRRVGLGSVVESNQPAQPIPLGLPATEAKAGPVPASTNSRRIDAGPRLPRPRVDVTRLRGGVLVRVRNRPRSALTVVSAHRIGTYGRLRLVAHKAARSSRVKLRVGRWDELRVRYLDTRTGRERGPVRIVAYDV